MKKKTYYSMLNYDHTKQPKEANNGESDVKPNQTLTIPEILRRFASGRSIDVPIYDDYQGDGEHLTGVDIRTMDLEEIHQLLEVTRQNINNLKLETDRRRKIQQDEDLEKSIIAKFKARQEAEKPQEDNTNPQFIQPKLPI